MAQCGLTCDHLGDYTCFPRRWCGILNPKLYTFVLHFLTCGLSYHILYFGTVLH